MTDEMRLVALNPAALEAEQQRLVGWCDRKAEEVNAAITDLDSNLALAQRAGFNTAPIRAALNREVKRYSFYKKLQAALDAGFYIVPNMQADIFAVRTKASAPPAKLNESPHRRWVSGAMPQKQLLPKGEGRYVSATHTVQERDSYQRDAKNYKGQPTKETVHTAVSVDFADEIDFPFTLARPEVMDATQRAMALKVFDELATIPATTRTDPMVIGRVYSGPDRHVSFLIAWFLDTEALR